MTIVQDPIAPESTSNGPDAAPSGPPAPRRSGRRLLMFTALGCVVVALVAFGASRLGEPPADRDPTAGGRPDASSSPVPGTAPPVPTAQATPEMLASLPPEFPTSLARSARAADRDVVGGKTVLTLALPSSTTAAEDLHAVGQRMRDAGWRVDPPSQREGFGFAGFGWSGSAAASADGEAIVIEMRRAED